MIKKSFLFFVLTFCFNCSFAQLKKENSLIDLYIKYKSNKEKSQRERDTAGIIYNLNLMASLEYNLGLSLESEQTAIKALKIQNQTKYKSSEISLNNHLGMINRILKNYDNALFYYKRLKTLVRTNKEKMALYNNLGVTFLYREEYNEAIEEFEKGLHISNLLGDNLKIAKSLDNLGFAQSKLGQKDALINMHKALLIRENSQKLEAPYASYKHLFSFYLDFGDNIKALHYAKKKYQLANRIKSPGYRLDALSSLIKLNLKDYFLEYNSLRDSIDSVEEKRKNQFVSLKYNYFEQEKLAKEEELKAEKAEKEALKYKSTVLIVFLLSIAGYVIYREKNKKKIVERVIETEGKISKTVHDVIANDVYHIMLKLQSDESKQDDILDDLEKVYERARDISRDNYIITEEMNFQEILQDLFSSYQNEEVTIITKQLKKVNWTKFSVQKKNMLYRVFKELMTNMKKYSKANLVTIAFEQKNKIYINYRDNGVGSDLSKKNGLLNAESRIKSVNGKITFISEPEKGFGIKIIV